MVCRPTTISPEKIKENGLYLLLDSDPVIERRWTELDNVLTFYEFFQSHQKEFGFNERALLFCRVFREESSLTNYPLQFFICDLRTQRTQMCHQPGLGFLRGSAVRALGDVLSQHILGNSIAGHAPSANQNCPGVNSSTEKLGTLQAKNGSRPMRWTRASSSSALWI
jgi:hypothetical protein